LSSTRNVVLAVLVLALTFATGVLAGAAAHHVVAARRGGGPAFAGAAMVRHLDRRLDLTDQQRSQIETIIRRRHEKMRTEVDTTNAEIARLLTPEQREKFEKMRLRMHRPHGKHR
jgi:Spy/CpxP family protein refolding chaperone